MKILKMTYEELKKIAEPHIRKNDTLPSNALLLLTQFHIPYKTEKQCQEDFKTKYNPLDNHPAFLYIKDNEKTLYFKTSVKYYNFYIFHEIAHYILGHETNSQQNEIDANLLACILAAPVENFPTTIKTAQDLSVMCSIPIDRAEEYWQLIKNIVPGRKRIEHYIYGSLAIIILAVFIIHLYILEFPFYHQKHDYNITNTSSGSINVTSFDESEDAVYVTTYGVKYHLIDCRYIKNKTNITEKDINTAINEGYTPCKICIK